MEFSVIIPKAAAAILKENPQAMKKCMKCNLACDNLTKFICLGFNAISIGDYLKKHPDFAEKVEKDFFIPATDFKEEDEDIEIIPILFND